MLDVVAVVLAALACVLAGLALRRTTSRPSGEGVDALPEDVHGLRQEVAALKAENRDALRHLSVVRYDAFGDVGGHLSWSLALLDDAGHGVVLTLDPRPQRGPHLRQVDLLLVVRAAALAGGGRGDRARPPLSRVQRI